MSDAKIDLKESTAPTHSIDGESLTNGLGQVVFRQKVSNVDVVDMLSSALYLLELIAGVAPARDPATHAAKVQVQGTVPVSGSLTTAGTVSTVSTLTTMANQTNFGGLPAQNQQFGHGAEASAFLVQRAVSGLWRSHGKADRASIFQLRCRATSFRCLRLGARHLVLDATRTRS